MNRIYRRGIKNRKIQKLTEASPQKDDANKIQHSINGFNIIELNEEEINSDLISEHPKLNEKEIDRIKKKAQSIEGYYLGKGEDSKINENCFNCLMNNFQANELLYFAKRKDLLTYLRYCFYFMKNILFTDSQIYTENKYDLDKCDTTNYLNGWKFFIPKTMCRGCFLQIINMEHLLGNLKTIFSDFDGTSSRRNFRRNRSYVNPAIRTRNNLIPKNESDDGENQKKKRGGYSHRRKNFRYNLKNNNKNISFDDKNGLILLKKNILSEDVVENLKENDKKNKFLAKKKLHDKNLSGEQMVTEIKIKANEFYRENSEIKLNKKINNDVKTEINEKKNEKNKLNIPKFIQNNIFSLDMNNISNDDKNNNNINENEKKNINDEKNITSIYNEIMKIKGISNMIVMKLFYKLDVLIFWMSYTLWDVGDFRIKLNNTLTINPFIVANFVPITLVKYEEHFKNFYNQVFMSRKEFEEIFKKIKNDSIPNITKNLNKLKAQENLKEEEIKALDEMDRTLIEYSNKISELEKKYNFRIKKYFTDFNSFLNLIGKIKDSFN